MVLLTAISEDTARAPQERRFDVEIYREGFFRVLLPFGFMDEPDVPTVLKLCHLSELDFQPDEQHLLSQSGDGCRHQANRPSRYRSIDVPSLAMD